MQPLMGRLLQEMTKGGKIQALANAVNDLDREMVKLKTQLEMKQSSLLDEQKRIQAAEKNVVEVSQTKHSRLKLLMLPLSRDRRPKLLSLINVRHTIPTSLHLPVRSKNTIRPRKT